VRKTAIITTANVGAPPGDDESAEHRASATPMVPC
jgi:hypothetical protein